MMENYISIHDQMHPFSPAYNEVRYPIITETQECIICNCHHDIELMIKDKFSHDYFCEGCIKNLTEQDLMTLYPDCELNEATEQLNLLKQ